MSRAVLIILVLVVLACVALCVFLIVLAVRALIRRTAVSSQAPMSGSSGVTANASGRSPDQARAAIPSERA